MKRHGYLGSGLAWLGLCIALVIFAGPSAQARLPYSDRIPADAMVAVGVGDTAASWGKVAGLPLTVAFQQFVASPEISGELGFQSFTLELQKMEQTTGYPLTMNEIMKNVVKDILIYVAPVQDAGSAHPCVMMIIGARDSAKAAKLVQVFDKKNQELAGGDSKSTATTTAKITFEKTKIGGVEVSHYSVGEGKHNGYYVLAGDRLVYADNAAAMAGILPDGAKPAQTLSQNPGFIKVIAALPWDEADFQGWVDGDAFIKMAGPMAAMLRNSMGGSLAKENKVAFVFNVQADGLVGRTASTVNPSQISPEIKPRKLAGVSQLPPTPMIGIDSARFDAQIAYKAFMNAAMTASGGTMTPDSMAAPFEQATGVSVQNELIPALGHEMVAGLNSLVINPQNPVPQIDLFVGFEMRDPAKMKSVMDKFEKYIEKQAAQVAPPPAEGATSTPAPSPKFQTMEKGPVPIRTISVGPVPGISPSYAYYKNYLLISLNTESLAAVIARAEGQAPTAASAPAYGELKNMAGTDLLLGYASLDVDEISKGILTPILPFLSMSMPPEKQGIIAKFTAFQSQVLAHVVRAASVETVKGDLSVGYLKLTLK